MLTVTNSTLSEPQTMSDKFRITIATLVTVLFLSTTVIAGALVHTGSPAVPAAGRAPIAVHSSPPAPQFIATDGND